MKLFNDSLTTRFNTLERNIKSKSNSFYDSYLDLLEATIKLIKDPKAKILLIPDSPTGADIIDTGTFKEINKSGNSKFTMRATAEIDYQNNTIHFSSIPLQTSTKDIISKILDFKKTK